MKIFWSWQSDTHQPSGRYFVRDVIADLCTDLSGGVTHEEAGRPDSNLEGDQVVEIDHDTLGVGGSPPISETILRKIREAAVFVADVTPICITSSGKRVPNPNVMIELGYALSVLGNERIVLVMNSADGAALEHLPFDLRHWRAPAQYSLAKDTNPIQKREQAKALKRVLLQRIQPGLKLANAVSAMMAKTPERMPELHLELDPSQQGPIVISQAPDFGVVKSLEMIQTEVPLLPHPAKNQPGIVTSATTKSAIFSAHIAKSVSSRDLEDVKAYNARVLEYYKLYGQYLENWADWAALKKRTFKIEFVLKNIGNLPATDIDVEIQFPEFMMLYEGANEFPVQPVAPKPPPLTSSFFDNANFVQPVFNSHLLALNRDFSQTIDIGNRRVSQSVPSLKHHDSRKFELELISFLKPEDIGSFDIQYRITAAEPEDPIEGYISIEVLSIGTCLG